MSNGDSGESGGSALEKGALASFTVSYGETCGPRAHRVANDGTMGEARIYRVPESAVCRRLYPWKWFPVVHDMPGVLRGEEGGE